VIIFYREPSVTAAQAGNNADVDGFACAQTDCGVLHGDERTFVERKMLMDDYNTGLRGNAYKTGIITTWR